MSITPETFQEEMKDMITIESHVDSSELPEQEMRLITINPEPRYVILGRNPDGSYLIKDKEKETREEVFFNIKSFFYF